MAKAKQPTNPNQELGRAALLPENRIKQLGALAFDLAEKRLRDGTATSQEVTYFLKEMSLKTQLENELLATQNELAKVKAESIQKQDEMRDLYVNAIKAMKKYQGAGEVSDEEIEQELY